MTTIAQLKRNIEGLNLHEVVMESIEETTGDLQALNTAQLAEGKLNDGSEITNTIGGYTGYSKPYAKKRSKLGLQTSFVDLRVNGRFYNEYNVKLDDSEIEISSTVPYSKYLEQMYTNTIFGLTPDNHREYVFERFFQTLKPKIETATKLELK